MSMSTFQKVTLVSCLVLCVALLLPKMLLSRGKRDAAQSDGPLGHFPPMLHRQPVGESQGTPGRQSSRAHNPEAIARAKGGGTGAGAGGKSNLAGQIIPVYGFGILLYILYILFKITSKGKTVKPPESRLSALRSENMKRKITDFELAQLQEKLKETEEVMERIVSKASHSTERVGCVSADQEERLLVQLREITRVMQERKLVEEISPETEAEYAQDMEDDTEEPHQEWHGPCCRHGHFQPPSEEMKGPGMGGVEGPEDRVAGDGRETGDAGPCGEAEDEIEGPDGLDAVGDSEDEVVGEDEEEFGGEGERGGEGGAAWEVEEQEESKHQNIPDLTLEENDDVIQSSNSTHTGSSLLRRRTKEGKTKNDEVKF